MATVLDFQNDVKGSNAYAPSPSTNLFSATLNNGAAASVTTPTGNFPYYVVSFSYQPGCNVWVSFTTTAAIPVGATFAANSSELNPGARRVLAGTVISLITDNVTADVGVAFYAVPQP